MGNDIKVTSKGSGTIGAYLSEPAEGLERRGCIVVIQEIFGVNSHIREVVDGYAQQGYVAIAPKIFDRIEANIELGYTESDMAEGIELAFQKLDLEQTLLDLQGTIDFAGGHGKVGVVGYCFGGLLTWLSACKLEGVNAASSYYGGGVVGYLELSPKCPTIMHFGELDAHIPLSDVDKIKSAHSNLPVYVYAADHGFNCDHRGSYDAEASKLAYERSLAHFAENLI
jgi:carboxymethylenebutenolidase